MSTIGSIGMRDPTAMQAAMHAKIFKSADQDASGGLSVDEFSAFAAKGPGGALPGGASVPDTFTSFDADGDGSLSQTELDTGMQGLMEKSFGSTQAFAAASRAGTGAMGGPPPGPPPDGADDGTSRSGESGAATEAASTTDSAGSTLEDLRARALQALLQAFSASSSTASSTRTWTT